MVGLLLSWSCVGFVHAQGGVAAPIVLTRAGDDVKIDIDGKLDEPIWAGITPHETFYVLEPDTLDDPPYPTRVRIFYTDRGLYVGAELIQPRDTLISRLSGRDWFMTPRDEFSFTVDTSGEGRYGYWFGIALGGSYSDGTVLPERQYANDWDGPWRGATAVTEQGWSAEIFVPWGTVSMPSTGKVRRMGIYMSRRVAHRNERWGFPAFPFTQPKFISALQPIEMEDVAPRQQYNIYPFASVVQDEIENDTRYRVGADLFWRPTTNSQLLATVNPDFGTVESDDVVVNLTATETFFPEKRLFFLEGQEIFVATPRAEVRRRGNVGSQGPPYTMVNTRRIGGKPQEPDLPPGTTVEDRELQQLSELMGAVKTTGQWGRLRYGVLGAFEDGVNFDAIQNGADINLKQEGSDYGIARVLYEDSPGGAYRALGFLSTAAMHYDRDAYAHGVDWHYLTPAGSLKMDGQAFTSDIEGVDRGYGGFVDFEYTYRQGLVQRVGIEVFDSNIDINDLGYLARNNERQIRSSVQYTRSDLSWARDNTLDVRGFYQKNGEGYFTRGGLLLADQLTFHNLSTLHLDAAYFPESYDDLNSFGNGTFRIEGVTEAGFYYESDGTQPLVLGMGAGVNGEQKGGNSYTIEGYIGWRPSDRFNASLEVKYWDRHGWLLHQEDANFTTFDAEQWQPKVSIEYFISARQQLRASLQWVGIKAEEKGFYLVPSRPGDLIPTAKPPGPADDFSLSQMSLQIRYRWEIAPLSDVFLVYTRLADQGAALGDRDFSDIFEDAYDAPLANVFVAKIRYRFGS